MGGHLALDRGVTARVRRVWARATERVRWAWSTRLISGRRRTLGVIESICADASGIHAAGWARLPGHPVVALVLLIDHLPVAVAPPEGNTGENVRWRVDGPAPVGRSVAVGVLAVTATGFVRQLAPKSTDVMVPAIGTVTITAEDEARDIDAPGELTSAVTLHGLDMPQPGDVVDGPTMTIAGWSLDRHLARIEVRIGERTELVQPMSLPRPDVAKALPDAAAPVCGFVHTIDIGQEPAGAPVRVEVAAVGTDGRRHVIGAPNVVIAATRPSPEIDSSYLAALQARVELVAKGHIPSTDGIRVLAVTHDLGLGGGQLYLSDLLIPLLADHGLSCTVVSPRDGPLRAPLEAAGARVHLSGTYPTSPYEYESAMRQLAAIAVGDGSNVVIANTMGAFIGVDLASRISIPSLWAIHESYPLERYWEAAYGSNGIHPTVVARAQAALRAASAVIFEADATRELYCGNGDPRRFIRIDYGIPIASVDAFRAKANRDELRARHGFAPEDIVVLCMGTIEPRKGQAMLIEAFVHLASRFPEAVLVLVGDRGDIHGDALRSYADRLVLGDRLRIVPVTPDAYEWYTMADAFALPSSVESLPRSVLEAMAFGVPVLCTDVFGLGELIVDRVNGLVVPPRDLAALEDGLHRIIRATPAERAALGAAGEAVVRARHDSAGYVGAYRSLLYGLSNDPAAWPGDLLAEQRTCTDC